MRILIADDESIIRLGLQAMLREMGHVVVTASNGREALQMARRHNPDLAILDVKMPFTDGLQVAQILGRDRPLPVILLTAFSDDDLIERASEQPIHGYLIKPVQAAEVKAAIAVATRRFEEQRALLAENEKLAEALAARKLIDRAKGKLMIEKGLSEQDAYRLLQMRARDARVSLQEMAAAVLKG